MNELKFLSKCVITASVAFLTYNLATAQYVPAAVNGAFLALGLLILLFSLWRIERSRRGVKNYELEEANKQLEASRSLAIIRDYNPPRKPYLFDEPEYAWVGTREDFLRCWPKEHPFQPGMSEDDRAISYRFVGFEPTYHSVFMYEMTAPGHYWDLSWDHYLASAKDRTMKPIK